MPLERTSNTTTSKFFYDVLFVPLSSNIVGGEGRGEEERLKNFPVFSPSM
jgi:hypothetical protein